MRSSPRITDFDRVELVRLAHEGCKVPMWHADEIGRCYDFALYVVPSAKSVEPERVHEQVANALQWWLRAPVQPLRHWSDYLPADFPETPVGMVLRAADARLRIETGKNVHQSGFAALVGLGHRRVRQLVEDGEIKTLRADGVRVNEWILAASARAWIEAKQAARAAREAEAPK